MSQPDAALPPVDEVLPGLWSIPVPIPINSLRYVLVYALETPRGPYLVDAGWNTDEAFDALAGGVRRMGSSITDVQAVLVTHIHPDHFGLAGRIREVSGAWIGLHPADAALVHDRYVAPDDLLEGIRGYLDATGAPKDEVDLLQTASMPVRQLVDAVEPDVLVEDRSRIDAPGWDLTALWTPGHSPGHLCFYEAERRLMLTGDHVLPRITPNISYHPQSGPDPLGDFLRSLESVGSFDVDLALPAHEYRFSGLRERTLALRRHHEQRFTEITAAVGSGVDTAWGIAARMTWSRSWDSLDGFLRRAALSEALAHLHALLARGVLAAVPGPPTRWHLAPR
ncbi:MAG: MBL fold metallo-hydrolase [Mycobacteriales bacterium]